MRMYTRFWAGWLLGKLPAILWSEDVSMVDSGSQTLNEQIQFYQVSEKMETAI